MKQNTGKHVVNRTLLYRSKYNVYNIVCITDNVKSAQQ